jgi:hypothetical protein
MPASYPTSAKAFTTKTNGPGQTIDASHVNDLQLEVTAIETDLIAGLPVARGGTGNTTLTSKGVMFGNGTSAVGATAAGTAGQVLTSSGAGVDPTWSTPSLVQTLACGRLTLTTATPVTTADVTAATTLYYALYGGNRIALYNGSAWEVFTIAELSIAVPATTSTMYDVFVDYNAGTPALSVTAWTNDTTRATALTKQDGVYVLTGSTGKRYVGSFRTTGVSGQTEDSAAKRYVWNYYNRVPRQMLVNGSGTWTYSTATWRQANNSATNQLDLVVGVAESAAQIVLSGCGANSTGGIDFYVGIGYDTTTAPSVKNIGQPPANLNVTITVSMSHVPAAGRHYYTWCEYAYAAGTTSWTGSGGQQLSNISGTYWM